MILSKETLIDRYGFPEGSFFSEKGVPYEQRALALHSDTADYHIYKVLENLEVMGGKAAPWFDRVGGGIQFIKYHKNGKTYSLQELIDEDLIVEVTFEREE
ncbi:TNT domain-containing protein [Bacillus sp. NTK071]|nr:TNT domain-containing protein [Bacillus sp. NTK071]MBN8209830.1 TNT domain-containing protein [Bacillus sp. NTK071]